MCALNKDERTSVKDQANGDSICRRRNNVYSVLVPMVYSKMYNAMILAFGGSFAGLVGSDKVMLT